MEPPGADLISRAVQGNFGIGLGMVAFGVAFGALFAVAFSLAWGRVGDLGPRPLALLLALGGFLTLYLAPFLKYPANPPAIGHEDTIGPRTGLYLVMVVGSLLAALLAVRLGRGLSGWLGGWNATLLGLLVFAVPVGVLMAVLPSTGQLTLNVEQYGSWPTETPLALRDAAGTIVFPGFDADLLYSFRLYSVAAAALLWATLGLCFGSLAGRVLSPDGRSSNAAPMSR
ncbi:MAG: CbtA family protein [Actinomycetota bacterium]|nr:CbtA family protein [Actinomycetota bacterium]